MKHTSKVPFQQVLGLAKALATQEGCSVQESTRLIGYSNGAMSHWRKAEEAPEIAKWAYLGRLEKAPDHIKLSESTGLTKEDVDSMLNLIISHGEATDSMLRLTAKLALMK